MVFLLYFAAGILNDFLFTLSLRYVAREKAYLASLVAFFNSVVSVGVLYTILSQLEEQRTFLAIVVYSLGIATGTFLAMKFKYGMKTSLE